MRIALGQLEMCWEDKRASLKKVEEFIRQAAAQQGEMILFPEMSLTGFSMDLNKIGEVPDHSETVPQMQKLALKYRIAIGFGWAALPEADQEKGTNRFTLVDDQGQIIGQYTKLHPFRYGGEADIYRGGDKLVCVPYKGHVFGLFICYDLRFPEIFQAASQKADVMIVIADWPASRRDHWLTLLKARAIENQAYVAGINCVGSLGGLEYSGDSSIVAPDGMILATSHGRESVTVCDIGEDVWSLRQHFPTKADRRNDLYIRELERISSE